MRAAHPADAIDGHFIDIVRALANGQRPDHGPGRPDVAEVPHLLRLFDSQLASRHLDLAARRLGREGVGYYTIGSSGHESNAAVAAALRPTDPALLHYRSGAFYIERAKQIQDQDPLRDILLGVVAAADEPITGGRHKVFGNHRMAVIPQTSTIGSHLPRALGVAFAIERRKKLRLEPTWAEDAVVICSFGDASVNHSTAVGALNAAMHGTFQGLPLPVLFVCEDNGIGISVRSPEGWVAANYRDRTSLKYFHADGYDILQTMAVARQAVAWARQRRRPAFLHLRTVRLMGHAGSDVESAYRRPAVIAAEQDRDPVLGTARLLVTCGVLTPDEVISRYESKREQVRRIADEVIALPTLDSREAVVAPLTRVDPAGVRRASRASAAPVRRRAVVGPTLPEHTEPLTLAQSINRSLLDVLAAYPQALVFGEDVAGKGGVYGVTRGLLGKVGAARVFDTLLDEQTILGLALGAGVSGMLPIPEIQYLAYLHNAEDQLRGEAASLAFFSAGQYRNPMVVRIAGYAYQKGFGGHFHNDNAVAVLRDVPGLVIASPARPEDAAAMLRTCVGVATVEGRPCVFLEPIALYHTRDLHSDGDGGWLAPYVAPDEWDATRVPIGRGRTYGDGADLTIVTFGNGLFMSLRVARRLERLGVHARVLDLRWLAPLPVDDLLREARATGRVLVVDETRRTGGVSEAVVTALVDGGFGGAVRRVTGADSFVPLGPAARHVLVQERDIEEAAVRLAR